MDEYSVQHTALIDTGADVNCIREDLIPLRFYEKTSHLVSTANGQSLKARYKLTNVGKDVSIENMHQGFTHVFESTFESIEGIAEYVSHPVHVEFSNNFLPALEKVIVIDYKPTPA
ncbi:stress-response A/B barrel domain-containing protein HS1-like [Asparagus officinalis]|uniref:stress-response A/B barrel domain-containing protein HS1-like n=1 Tax=Asparagus officinalis TaxID=4686 RepID=UPI00098E2CBD|nr:stress-response A/B barrel domain-containing protein HS1-like [Asparagus officinalis]